MTIESKHTNSTGFEQNKMPSDDQKPLINLDNSNEIDDMDDDDSNYDDITDGNDGNFYDEHLWPVEEPSVITFKGKKKGFVKAVDGLKRLMKKGNEKSLDNVSFKILDSRKYHMGQNMMSK